MYLVNLFEGPIKDDGGNVPLFDIGVPYGVVDDVDKPLRSRLKDMLRLHCWDETKKFFVQVWDSERQAWYKPWNGTWFEPGSDGLIPCENVSQVGPLRL